MTATDQPRTTRRVVRGPAPGAVAAAKLLIKLSEDPRFKDLIEITDEDRRVAEFKPPSAG